MQRLGPRDLVSVMEYSFLCLKDQEISMHTWGTKRANPPHESLLAYLSLLNFTCKCSKFQKQQMWVPRPSKQWKLTVDVNGWIWIEQRKSARKFGLISFKEDKSAGSDNAHLWTKSNQKPTDSFSTKTQIGCLINLVSEATYRNAEGNKTTVSLELNFWSSPHN